MGVGASVGEKELRAVLTGPPAKNTWAARWAGTTARPDVVLGRGGQRADGRVARKGPLAQLVAHLHDAQGVRGSSPLRPTPSEQVKQAKSGPHSPNGDPSQWGAVQVRWAPSSTNPAVDL